VKFPPPLFFFKTAYNLNAMFQFGAPVQSCRRLQKAILKCTRKSGWTVLLPSSLEIKFSLSHNITIQMQDAAYGVLSLFCCSDVQAPGSRFRHIPYSSFGWTCSWGRLEAVAVVFRGALHTTLLFLLMITLLYPSISGSFFL
jgi:hypothetical protein